MDVLEHPPKAPRVLRRRTTAETAALFLRPDATVQDAMACIDRSKPINIALIVDDANRLLNLLTEGDIRRGLLQGVSYADSVAVLVAVKSQTRLPLPITAPENADDDVLLALMRGHRVRQMPVVTAEGHVVDLVTIAELLPSEPRSLQAMVMAGGFGTRLRPLTENLPKPMLPVGGRPLIELIIHQLRHCGIRKVNISTHYQAEKIVNHFGIGEKFGVDISYTQEQTPLGTAGALRLLPPPGDPLLVINGDILTDVDFGAMHLYHQDHDAVMTVAVRRYEVQVPYGVIETDGAAVCSLREKPNLSFFVNAGIYLLEPKVYEYIPPNKPYNMTELMEALLQDKQSVVSFPLREYWLDIGQHADYERAQRDAEMGKWQWTGTEKLSS